MRCPASGLTLYVVRYEIEVLNDGRAAPIGGETLDIVQKAQLKVSEIKAKITDLLETAEEKRGEDYDGDLEKAMKQVRPAETQLQAALLAQPEETAEKVVEKRAEVFTETAEEREETELRSKINFGRYIGAAMAGDWRRGRP